MDVLPREIWLRIVEFAGPRELYESSKQFGWLADYYYAWFQCGEYNYSFSTIDINGKFQGPRYWWMLDIGRSPLEGFELFSNGGIIGPSLCVQTPFSNMTYISVNGAKCEYPECSGLLAFGGDDQCMCPYCLQMRMVEKWFRQADPRAFAEDLLQPVTHPEIEDIIIAKTGVTIRSKEFIDTLIEKTKAEIKISFDGFSPMCSYDVVSDDFM